MKGVKRGDGEEEGIYLLAKDLAYNVALDQTEQLTKGIHGLAKKEMYAVNQAINILDSKLEEDICKAGAFDHTSSGSDVGELTDKCGKRKSSHNGNAAAKGLNTLWKPSNTSTGGGNYEAGGTDKMGEKTSAKISTDITALNREQKGVVSSAFAKAHEGA